MKSNKNGEVWFKIGDKQARFGLKEFVLVTGLNVCDDNDVVKTLGAECRIVKEYFKNSGGKITKGDVYNAFAGIDRNIDVCPVGHKGKYLHQFMVAGLGGLFGQVREILAFEAIPTLGMEFATKYPDVILRMVAWEMLKRLVSVVTNIVLKSKEVNSTLIPTEAELEKVYWKELTPIVGEDESASHHSKRDEAKHDIEPHHAYHEESPRAAQPPQPGFKMSIADLLRTKMEKLKGRLQVVISTQLDRVEKKVNTLVELAVAGRFHPATSAFDSTTSSIAYVPENEPNDGLEMEAMFDDVTDVPAAERKVDLPEEDLKLEDDVRGKNRGGNKLETKLGFDYMRDVPTAATNVEAREEDPKLKEKGRGKNVGGKDLEKEAGSGNDIDEQKNEKMVKESVGKEIILEENHLDVEKKIADFVTPKKHDLATNEST
ncbi:Hypothetical predicted protein [Olea europaea subsp. europaea]|uniref:Uncharacterized protein n=1 Tax=Olea europaea subsp. europaea TaxID=158383 RepID=A0A8S0PTS9_OLEEU|nr:Hypothetical predicted protein [Olea europaea subsp. europaea]